MANAGKIMIMPKGAYDASASYEVLDLVTHKGNVWVAKRNVTGVEPSEANSADWFLMADLANYMPKSGRDYFTSWVGMKANGFEQSWTATNDTAGIYDDVHKKWVYVTATDGTSAFNGIATGNLPLSGGEIKSNAYYPLIITNQANNHSIVCYKGIDGILGYLGMLEKNKPIFMDTEGIGGTLLHTGNKPTGGYTGTAEGKTVETGGIGSLIYIYDKDYLTNAIIGENGGIFWTWNATSVAVIKSTDAVFSEGVLKIFSANEGINKVGVYYRYQVL